jgi:hypothetical protein
VQAGPVVVVMLTHRDPPQVQRLVDRVCQGDDVAVVVHHDPRGPELALRPSAQVHRVAEPVAASWGRIGLARAVLTALTTARTAVPELSWALVVSGQDYPSRPMTSIEQELRGTEQDAFLRWFPVGDPADDVIPWQARCRSRYLHSRRLPGSVHHVPAPRRHPFRGGLGLYVADMWPNLSAAALDHVLVQRRRRPEVERYLATCQVPDEALVPTLLLNDRGDLRVSDDGRRFIRWTPGAPHPETLTVEDEGAIRAGDSFFARKVDIERSAELMDRLDQQATTR